MPDNNFYIFIVLLLQQVTLIFIYYLISDIWYHLHLIFDIWQRQTNAGLRTIRQTLEAAEEAGTMKKDEISFRNLIANKIAWGKWLFSWPLEVFFQQVHNKLMM